MKYLSLDSYRYAWFYQHKDLPVLDSDLDAIKPCTSQQSNEIWRSYISQDQDYIDELTAKDWPAQKDCWLEEDQWQSFWNDAQPALPGSILSFIPWEDNKIVYFCYSADHVVETTWGVFQRCWKNFLFLDDGPILIGKKRKEAVQFNQNGQCQMGMRSV